MRMRVVVGAEFDSGCRTTLLGRHDMLPLCPRSQPRK